MVKEAPLISIIIPVYNTAKYLRRCLESVCNQTYSNIEVLCIDDGSSDNSLHILHEYAKKDPRIKVYTQMNSGAAIARNVGLEQARGEWVTGLDSDDFLDLDACEYVVQNIVPEADIITFDIKVTWEGVVRDIGFEKYYNRGMSGVFKITPEFIIGKPGEFCSKFWNKCFLSKYLCRFPDGLSYEDMYFYWAYMPLAKYIVYLPEAKYNYVRRADSNTSSTIKKWSRALDYMYLIKKLLDARLDTPLPPKAGGLNLLNFLYCYRYAVNYVPENLLSEVHRLSKEIVEHRLLKPWKKWLISLTDSPMPSRFYANFQPGAILFGCFYRYFLGFHIEHDSIVMRLFGKRVYKRSLFR